MTDSLSNASCLPQAMANCLSPRFESLMTSNCSVVRLLLCTKGPCPGRSTLSGVRQS